MSLVGKKVKVHFNPETWPISSATYIYEGRDETGHFLRRSDGVQRHMRFTDVLHIEPVSEDVPEAEF